MPSTRSLLIITAVLGAFAVGSGAFGAHALRDTLDASALALWRTAVDYLFWHVLAALFAARYAESAGARGAAVAAMLFLAGAFVFASTLFALALGAPRVLGAVTPLGGAALMAGWFTLAWAASRQKR